MTKKNNYREPGRVYFSGEEWANYLDPSDDYDVISDNTEIRLDNHALVKQALGQLTQQQRAAIVLDQGLLDRVYTRREISDILGVDESRVSRLIKTGMERLQEFMNPDSTIREARKAFMELIR